MERLRKTRANAFDGARSDAHLDDEDAFLLLVSSGWSIASACVYSCLRLLGDDDVDDKRFEEDLPRLSERRHHEPPRLGFDALPMIMGASSFSAVLTVVGVDEVEAARLSRGFLLPACNRAR